MRFIVVYILIIFNFQLVAQNKELLKPKKDTMKYYLRGLQYGFNIGVYIPNAKTANYYNGSGTNDLSKVIMDTFNYAAQYSGIHQQIRENALNGYDFKIRELAKNMNYSIALNIGFHSQYNFTSNTGIFVDFNYSKLTTQDAVQLELLNTPTGYLSNDKFRFCNITGKESRVDINLGLYKMFGDVKKFKPYYEFAFNINNTRVEEANINIPPLSFSYLNQYNEYYKIRDDGIGYGIQAGGGILVLFTETLILNAGANLAVKKINLGSYDNYGFNPNVYIRILFRNLISAKPE
ncbi:MAG: hypothetical protein KA792_04040 [Bacteroidales bacterium]|nr:hypothetical protein [Bacteroidales bacterium]